MLTFSQSKKLFPQGGGLIINMWTEMLSILNTPKKRSVLVGVTSAQTLIQISSLPIALSVPSIARYYDTSLTDTTWIVIAYLITLGGFSMTMARFGDRIGHSRVFITGILVTTIGAALITFSKDLWQIVAMRGLTGIGAAMILGNSHSILAATFTNDERGRAFAIPVMGARFGSLIGLAIFGILLQFLSWKWVFISFVPLGIISLLFTIPLLNFKNLSSPITKNRVDLIGGILLAVTVAVLLLSGNHLHSGEESFTSPDAVKYHLPMHTLFIILLGLFIFVESKIQNPLIDLKQFKRKYFSLALVANLIFHGSMMATMTLIPILVEQGFGRSPLWVTFVLFPNQLLGMSIPFFAGAFYDKYHWKFLRPGALVLISSGFLLLGLLSLSVPFWAMPLLLLPVGLGTAVFNTINNATVMNCIPHTERGFASGMLETTREAGHGMGATISSAMFAIMLPSSAALISTIERQPFIREAFQVTVMMVVITILLASIMAYFHKDVDAENPSNQFEAN